MCSPRGSITTMRGFHCVSRANPFLGGEAVRFSQETDAAFIIQTSHILQLWSEPLGSLECALGNSSSEVLGSCHSSTLRRPASGLFPEDIALPPWPSDMGLGPEHGHCSLRSSQSPVLGLTGQQLLSK